MKAQFGLARCSESPISIWTQVFYAQQDFNYGVEFILLISFLETASREAVEDAFSYLEKLISQHSSFIVQATSGMISAKHDCDFAIPLVEEWGCRVVSPVYLASFIYITSNLHKRFLGSLSKKRTNCAVIFHLKSGCCLNHMDSRYSHAAVIRFPSCKISIHFVLVLFSNPQTIYYMTDIYLAYHQG